MSQFIFKMPDLGEGTVEAEIVAWRTAPGAVVTEDQVICEVMTDKAAVEVPAPVSGRVLSISGEPGDKIAVGSPLIVFETTPDAAAVPATIAAARAATAVSSAATVVPSEAPFGRIKTSPANRRRAREAGIDLRLIAGTGPGGRIVRSDLKAATEGDPSSADAHGDALAGPRQVSQAVAAETSAPPEPRTTEIKVIGVRRVIAERMSEAKRTIPHFAYVEEVDITELEALRQHLNESGTPAAGAPSARGASAGTPAAAAPAGAAPAGAAPAAGLTYLPFVVLALTRALQSFPQCNVRYDAARGVLVRHQSVHVGVATQTPDGLKVPVVRDAQALSLWELAAAIRRVSERARTNQATREELNGSTITVTSLGKWGGIASTPVINSPEVAIIGLNKATLRPVVHDGGVAVRRIMNLSSSFDHRFVDGYDAAAMIQALKELLEHPATIFIPKVTTP
jgi:2-oxoisovalerate dehydrogenase E2 component (dihydrolipoyl transacylase)